MSLHPARRLLIASAAFLCLNPVWASEVFLSIIIDDLGNALEAGQRTVRLDGPVACAILPHTPFGGTLATQARDAGKEVMLHLPLQSEDGVGWAGPGEIGLNTTREQFRRILHRDLKAVPHIVGVNTHMGSLVTRHPGHMSWLMEELSQQSDLFFVDSFTTPESVALNAALEWGIPAARRDVFLDDDRSASAVDRAFDKLLRVAKEQGHAIGIGHPYPATLEVLERRLPELTGQGIVLIPVSDVVQRKRSRDNQLALLPVTGK